VKLHSDFASIYGVETKAPNRAVKRNRDRFPKDFLFQLTEDKWKNLRYQISTARASQPVCRPRLSENASIARRQTRASSKLAPLEKELKKRLDVLRSRHCGGLARDYANPESAAFRDP
jgi:hypothetical protein